MEARRGAKSLEMFVFCKNDGSPSLVYRIASPFGRGGSRIAAVASKSGNH